jgi:hypothetical protein
LFTIYTLFVSFIDFPGMLFALIAGVIAIPDGFDQTACFDFQIPSLTCRQVPAEIISAALII